MFEDHGVKVLVDPRSLTYLDGTQLDYVREGSRTVSGSQPERDRCGCRVVPRLSRPRPSREPRRRLSLFC